MKDCVSHDSINGGDPRRAWGGWSEAEVDSLQLPANNTNANKHNHNYYKTF